MVALSVFWYLTKHLTDAILIDMNKPKYLFWCDLETTGLDPKTDDILEMALVVTDSELNELGRFHHIFQPVLDFHTINPNVIKMHTDNGLWKDVIEKGYPHASLAISDFMFATFGNEFNHNTIYLAGSSVHFDKKFLDAKYSFHRDFSHRIFDVSVIRTMLKMWDAGLLWEQNGTHRAMDDILDHIEEAKHYRKVLVEF